MAKKKTKEREDPVFVGITDAQSIRKNLLESSKATLIMLRRIETIKDIRAQKRAHAEELQAIFRDVKVSFSSLKKILPAVEYPKAPVKQVLAKGQPVVEKKRTEINHLEAELAAIEAKLKKV